MIRFSAFDPFSFYAAAASTSPPHGHCTHVHTQVSGVLTLAADATHPHTWDEVIIRAMLPHDLRDGVMASSLSNTSSIVIIHHTKVGASTTGTKVAEKREA